jgi:hypothetical protein
MSDAGRIAALERRIEALEDREEIRALVYRYTELIRMGRPSEVLALMAEDAVVELHHADPDDPSTTTLLIRFVGHDEIRYSFREHAGEGVRVWPMLHNLQIEIDGDRASSVCVIHSSVWPVGRQFVGEYRDSFRRIEGHWRLTSRQHVGFGDTDGAYAREAHQAYLAIKPGAAQT